MAQHDLIPGELVARCRAGDEAAWAELVEHFSRYVYAITTQAFRLSQHEAEDVFQEVFTRAYEKLHTLRDDDAIRPWLAQMTRRLAIDRIRAGGREVSFAEPPDEIVEGEIARVDAAMTVRDALRSNSTSEQYYVNGAKYTYDNTRLQGSSATYCQI